MLTRQFILTSVLATALHATIIHDFDASAGGPNTQGWTGQSGITSGAAVTDLGQSAWRMTGDNCCGYWNNPLTAAQWTDAFNVGWSLRGTARSTGTTGVGYMFLDVPLSIARPRFDLAFGNDGVNGWAGLSSWFDSANPALKTTFSGNTYHLLDMRWNATTQNASLWVDGVLALSGYTGHSQFRESHGPAFGVSGLTTQGNFQNVEFSINYPVAENPVPEPATAALVGMALVFIWRGKRLAQLLSMGVVAGMMLSAATIGESLIDRPFIDTVQGAGFIYQGALPLGEQVVSFGFFNNNPANTNYITPLLFDTLANGQYQIVGIGSSRQNSGLGMQNYAFDLQAGSNVIGQADFVFGWWNGRITGGNTFLANTGLIEFSAAASNPGVRESCPQPNIGPCAILPSIGLTKPFNNIYAGASSGSLGAPNGRVYSVQVTTAESSVPEPSTTVMIIGALSLFGIRKLWRK